MLWWADQWDPSSTLFTLDTAAEETDRDNIDVGVTSTFEALNNTAGVLCDVITSAGRVQCDPTPWVSTLAFRVSISLFPL